MSNLSVDDPARRIAEFTVSEAPGGWSAVHMDDPTITVEAPDWDRLELYCAAQRIARTLRQAAFELASWGRWDSDD